MIPCMFNAELEKAYPDSGMNVRNVRELLLSLLLRSSECEGDGGAKDTAWAFTQMAI